MKKYEMPKVELTKFDIEDVITASGDPIDVNVNDTTAVADAKTDILNNGGTTGITGVFTW